jgi:elongation factor 1 alpha-like protein
LTLDAFEYPSRNIEDPFSLSVQDYYKGGVGPSGTGSVTLCGRIASGSIQVGDQVLSMPINQSGVVKAIQVGDDESTWAVAGDRVSISINGLDVIQVHLGTVLCDPAHPVPVTNQFRAEISTFDLSIPITIGVPVVMHHLGTCESGRIILLESVKTDKGDKKYPRSLTKNQTATVVIQLDRSICIQPVSKSKELSRFLLRKATESVAAGIAVALLQNKN